MRHWFLICGLLFLFSCTGADDTALKQTGLRQTIDNKEQLLKKDKAKEVMETVAGLLKSSHYNAHPIDDNVSKVMFSLFVKALDPFKNVLLEPDIQKLSAYELKLDDVLESKDLTIISEASDLLRERLKGVIQIYQEILSSPIDIAKAGELSKGAKNMTWCKTPEELKERWVQMIRQMVISNYISLLVEKETIKTKVVKPEGSASDTKEEANNENSADSLEEPKDLDIDYAKIKGQPIDAEKLEEACKRARKTLDFGFAKREKEGEVGVFNSFMNALCGAYGPHTFYHMPEEKESIDIDLTGSLQGIGAQLQENTEEVKVMKIIPGSASWKQKQLGVGDVILKVGQGDQEPVDIRGMGLSDAVRLIRGKKGTEVRLTVKKPDGQIMIIPIIRDVVVLEDSYVHSMIVDDPQTKQKIGYILLPSFYLEQDKEKGRSCAADVKKDLLALKAQGVDGIIFDLRNNGGGSLRDVVEMAGLFITSGPIVQVKGFKNSRNILEDPDKNIVYDGSMVVMINNFSASASEIFAAAMQDYGRAVILGAGASSFGKGTVQTFVPLQEYLRHSSSYDIGTLRLTIQKFYRINGQTTQFKGVIPDIILPVESMYLEIGERFLDNPLPSDLFLPTSYEKWKKPIDLNQLKSSSAKRTSSNPFFKQVDEYAMYLKSRQDEKTIRVSLGDAFKELEEAQKRNAEFKKDREIKREIKMTRITAVNTAESGMFQEMEKALPKDPYIFEAMDILKDMQAK